MWIPLAVFFALTLIGLSLAWGITRILSYPPRSAVNRPPQTNGLPYEAVNFKSTDGLTLNGWWIEQQDRVEIAPSVILVHPLGGNRSGFQRRGWMLHCRLFAEIDFFPLTAELYRAGFNVLMFDLRGHGESDLGRCAGGLNEDQDVEGAVRYVFERLRREHALLPVPGEQMAAEEQLRLTPPVGILGYGLGGTAALAAVGRKKGGTEILKVFNGDCEGGVGYLSVLPDEVKLLRFLVLLEPASLGAILNGGLGSISPLLAGLMHACVNWMIGLQGSYPLNNLLLLRFARQINPPVMFLRAGCDDWGTRNEIDQLFTAVTGAKQLWQDEACRGRMQLLHEGSATYARILAFAQENSVPQN